MVIHELIKRLTEIEKYVGKNTEVCILNDSSVQYADWLNIADLQYVNGNEEEMTSPYVYLEGIAENFE